MVGVLGSVGRLAAADAGAPAAAGAADTTSELARQLEELKATVASQGKIINELRKGNR